MGKGKLWHPADQKPLNRSSPNLIHVITSWVLITKQSLDAIRPGVSFPHIRDFDIFRIGAVTSNREGMLNLLNLFGLKRLPHPSQFHIVLFYVLWFHVLLFHALQIGPSSSRPSSSRPAFLAPPT